MLMLTALALAGADVPDLDRAFAEARSTVLFENGPNRQARRRGAQARRLMESDIDVLSATCAAAARSGEREVFLVRLAHAYGMTGDEAAELRRDCRLVAAALGRR